MLQADRCWELSSASAQEVKTYTSCKSSIWLPYVSSEMPMHLQWKRRDGWQRRAQSITFRKIATVLLEPGLIGILMKIQPANCTWIVITSTTRQTATLLQSVCVAEDVFALKLHVIKENAKVYW